ncbi:hypothetical protein AEST_24130 [Alishewanella aestuarii B11]|uniref:Uncharacterized protein n=1 Tax=Alishewanella aestuarii B11 TaxID=1197174 RepID=J1Q129_9ALTE|nr:hypothetical protein AEST_24130 [Alishewanella aestuarii B11]
MILSPADYKLTKTTKAAFAAFVLSKLRKITSSSLLDLAGR